MESLASPELGSKIQQRLHGRNLAFRVPRVQEFGVHGCKGFRIYAVEGVCGLSGFTKPRFASPLRHQTGPDTLNRGAVVAASLKNPSACALRPGDVSMYSESALGGTKSAQPPEVVQRREFPQQERC